MRRIYFQGPKPLPHAITQITHNKFPLPMINAPKFNRPYPICLFQYNNVTLELFCMPNEILSRIRYQSALLSEIQ